MIRQGRRPGDQRVRVSVPVAQQFRIDPPSPIRRPPSPWRVLIVSIALLIAAGSLLLLLPFATEERQSTSVLDAVFTATSAVSTTGLVIADTATRWTAFGEVVILVLIQLGGFAFMTGSTLLLRAVVGGRSSLQDRIRVQAAAGVSDLGSLAGIVRRVAVFTLACEGVGAALLLPAFLARGESPGTAAWWAVFHSVSAFNNAGFDLFGGFRSLTHLADATAVLVPLGALIVLGGTGYAIVADIAAKRRWTRLALETKVVLVGTAALIAGGALATAAFEWGNPETLARLEPGDRVVNAIFHSVSLRSAGFDSVGVGALLDETLVVGIALMFIGGASGSTAGGIRINTVAALIIASVSAGRGLSSATAFGRRLPHELVYRAVAVLVVALAGATVLAILLGAVERVDLVDLVFEEVSALGTVGLSTVGTQRLDPLSQVLLAIAMFVGRLGPLTLVFAFAARSRRLSYSPAAESIRIG